MLEVLDASLVASRPKGAPMPRHQPIQAAATHEVEVVIIDIRSLVAAQRVLNSL
jgi:hypothetical protein